MPRAARHACVTTTLAVATEFLPGHARYDVCLVTPGGRHVTARPGLRLEAQWLSTPASASGTWARCSESI